MNFAQSNGAGAKAPRVCRKGLWLAMFMVCLLTGLSAKAQNSITGTVTDEQGEPLIGASVFVVGTNTGTATDADGD